jgi:hypothetical protein
MSHFAELKDGVVQRVIVAEQDFINSGAVGDSFNWVQTSYNNYFRKQFGGVGYNYNASADVFVQPQPYPSWTLDENHDWQPPTPKPGGRHTWNEETQAWDQIDD